MAGFSAEFDEEELRRRLEEADRRIRDDGEATMRVIGVQTLSLAQIAYGVKSNGGTGSDGIRWKPLAESTKAKKSKRGKRNDNRKATKSGKARPAAGSTVIGIDTGLQRASGSPGFTAAGGGNVLRVTPNSVTVGYGRSYSKYFDEERKLLPERLPEEWERQLDATIERRADKILREVLER